MLDAFSIAQTLSVILWGLVLGIAGIDFIKRRPIMGLWLFGMGFFIIRIAADILEDGRPDRIIAAMVYWTVSVLTLQVVNEIVKKKYGE